MSLEYAITYPCPVRQRISTNQIFGITRAIAWLNAVRDASLATGNPVARVVTAVATPDGQEIREYPLAQLAGEVAEQNYRYAAICRQCPIAQQLQTGLFGCVGRINYPISTLCEEQLAAIAHRAWAEHTPAAMTLQAMVSAHFGRTPSERTWMGRLRRERQGAERPEPIVLLQLKRREQLTTDHLFSLLLSNGTVRGNRLRLVATFLRELHSTFRELLASHQAATKPIVIDHKCQPASQRYRPLNVRTAGESLQQFIAYADAVLLAKELDCAVYLHG